MLKSLLNFSKLKYINPSFLFKKSFTNNIQRDEIETDVLIVGGGPAGLATAIKLQQLAKQQSKQIDVTIVEKGSEIGAHILSGNCLEVSSLTELIPDWKIRGAPISTEVTKDKFIILTKNKSIHIPEFLLPSSIHNKGNYIISLSQLSRWLAQEAEELGVNIFTGFAANDILYNDENSVGGIILNDFGIDKAGKPKDNFQAGNIIKAKVTVLAEGSRGSLSERVINKFNLRTSPQHYGIGLKEVWEVPEGHANFQAGLVQHTVNWPLDMKTYGGSFMYHMKPNLIHIGFVVGLDYSNPYLNPYEEFQRFKTHKEIRKYLDGGRCIQYGSRVLNEGGYYSIPKLTFPGGLLVGDSAGFLNVSKIKGTHNAISSGMMAAEVIFNQLCLGTNMKSNKYDLTKYEADINNSKIKDELFASRNFHGAFSKGLLFGLAHGFITSITGGKEFWEFKPKKRDSQYTMPAEESNKIDYPKHDGVITFDLLDNLARSGTNHDHDQPSHLKVKQKYQESPMKSLKEYGGPEERFCPAKVYEFVNDEKDGKNNFRLQINAQNCLHCKCCSIKMIDEYIDWNVPQGGEENSTRFEKELKNKISLKMIPNQNEDQILIKYFKYFDLENSGFCNLQNFIKTIDKIGVVMRKIHDLQEVFDYYDKESNGVLDYKKFSVNLFKKEKDEINKQVKTQSNSGSSEIYSKKKKEIYFDKLHSILKPNGGKGLIQLCKDFKMIDYNNTNRLNIDNFIKIITETKIPLNINEIQLLFHSYEPYNNSLFYYEDMFTDLKSLYHNEKRVKFIDSFYKKLIESVGSGESHSNAQLKLSDLKLFFNPRNHPLFSHGVTEEDLRAEFVDIVDSFQFIKKLKKVESIISYENFVDFFKFFGFGIDQDDVFIQLISSIFTISSNQTQSQTHINTNNSNSNNTNNQKLSSNVNVNLALLDKLKNNLKNFGRKSLFNLIKHFKYYDNGTKYINKYDFAKVLRDFRLNLTVNEIEKLFNSFCNDKKQMLLNYEDFVLLICDKPIFNRNTIILINQIYESLRNLSEKNQVDLNLIKKFYNWKDYENEIMLEFFECLELYHSYKNKKNLNVSAEEFEEFYRIISFLIDNDESFEKTLRDEWKIVLEMIKQELPQNENGKNNPTKDHTTSKRPVTPLTKNLSQNDKEIALAQNQYHKPKTPCGKSASSLEKLKLKLRKRGIRGLMNLHKQFLLNCTNLNTVSHGDFVKVLKLQRIDLNKDEYDLIFEKFRQEQQQFLNFSAFIRNFKIVLDSNRLQFVEKAFSKLDIEKTEMLFIEDIKLKFDASNHPDVVRKIRYEDDVTMEFLDCFELNYNFLATNYEEENQSSSNLVSFEEFANFYEYVSFLYDSEEDFISVISSTWNI